MNEEGNRITRMVELYRYTDSCYEIITMEITILGIIIGLVTKSLFLGILSIVSIYILIVLAKKVGMVIMVALTLVLSYCWGWLAYTLSKWLFDSTFEAVGLCILAFLTGVGVHANGFGVLRSFKKAVTSNTR